MEHAAMSTKSRCRRLPSPGGPGPAGHIRLYDQEGLELRSVGLGQATENHSFFLAPGSYRLNVEGDPL
jgi:hypothetical protein